MWPRRNSERPFLGDPKNAVTFFDRVVQSGRMIRQKIANIFSSRRLELQKKARGNNLRFVHYTSGEAAVSILRNNVVWLRNSRLMNDYSEIDYGLNIIRKTLFNSEETSFWEKIARITGQDREYFRIILEENVENVRSNTYILSLCEHDKSDDDLGRLSMWRGYGTSVGVAIVANPVSDFLSAVSPSSMFFPVIYADDDDFASLMDDVSSNLALISSGPDTGKIVEDVFIDFLKSTMFYLKHPGFKEEQEWRVVYNDQSPPISSRSKHEIKLKSSVQTIRGIPQLVFELPFRNNRVKGMAPTALIHKIIVGPATYPRATQAALAELIGKPGKVVISDLPFRQV